MFPNCAEVRARLVGGVEKVSLLGGVELQDVNPLEGECLHGPIIEICEEFKVFALFQHIKTQTFGHFSTKESMYTRGVILFCRSIR